MSFRVLQWNVWFEENIERVVEFLKDNPADIICLQELTKGYAKQTKENTWEYVAHELGYDCHYQAMSISTPGGQWEQANAIFSKYPLSDKKFEWVKEPVGDHGYDNQRRVYIEAACTLDGQRITIGTTHLSYTDNFAETDDKRDETGKLLEHIGAHKQSYIFTGDLNALPNSEAVTRITKVLEHAGPDMSEKTWTTKPFVYRNFRAETLDWRLDYVFSTPDLKVKKAQTLKTDISDHLPVLVEF